MPVADGGKRRKISVHISTFSVKLFSISSLSMLTDISTWALSDCNKLLVVVLLELEPLSPLTRDEADFGFEGEDSDREDEMGTDRFGSVLSGAKMMLLLIASLVKKQCTAVTRCSGSIGIVPSSSRHKWPSRLRCRDGFHVLSRQRTLPCSFATEIGGPWLAISSSCISALVKECGPTPEAVFSNPQAAMASVTPCSESVNVGCAAWQQSSNNRTSASASSS